MEMVEVHLRDPDEIVRGLLNKYNDLGVQICQNSLGHDAVDYPMWRIVKIVHTGREYR